MSQGFIGKVVIETMPTLTSDSGTATASGNNIDVLGGTLINTAAATDTLTVNAADSVIASVGSDSGTATGSSNAISIVGTGGVTTSATGSTVTVDGSGAGGGATVLSQATTSGSTVTLSGIPSGTKLIILSLAGVSVSASGAEISFRLGDSGGIETTGYISNSHSSYNAITPTDFHETDRNILFKTNLSYNWYGTITMTLTDGTSEWVSSGVLSNSNAVPFLITCQGYKATSSELTQIQFLTTTGSFDNGSIVVTCFS